MQSIYYFGYYLLIAWYTFIILLLVHILRNVWNQENLRSENCQFHSLFSATVVQTQNVYWVMQESERIYLAAGETTSRAIIDATSLSQQAASFSLLTVTDAPSSNTSYMKYASTQMASQLSNSDRHTTSLETPSTKWTSGAEPSTNTPSTSKGTTTETGKKSSTTSKIEPPVALGFAPAISNMTALMTTQGMMNGVTRERISTHWMLVLLAGTLFLYEMNVINSF